MRKLYTTKATSSNYSAKLLVFAILLFLCAYNSYSQVIVPFTPRTSTVTPSKTIYTVKGDFSMIGNTNLTLASYGVNTNNNHDMIYVDIDNDSNTINSSSATLTFSDENGAVPECSNIVYAGLYWTGRAGNDETVTVGTKVLDKRKVLIKKGAAGTYEPVIANTTSITNKNIYFPSGTEDNIYSAYAEITDFVKNNGLGEYFVADIASLEGNPDNVGNYGGWGMVVVYENSKMNWRDVTVFDGFAYVKGPKNANYTFDINGFNTAISGDLNIKLGVMAGEGDTGVSGDYFQIQRQDDSSFQSLSHSLNSTNNFFNSSINTGGNYRNPLLTNNTGIDIAMFNIDNTDNGIIKNGDTSTKFRYGSTQDTYVIFNITFSIDAYVPEVTGVIANTSINGAPNTGSLSIEPGQTADYTLEIKNVGTEATDNTVITIPLPDTVDPSVLNFSSSMNYTPTTQPTYNSSLGSNGSIVWNLGTLPLPADPTTVLAELSFSLTATTDCSLISGVDPSITLYGSISGNGAISNVTFDTPLVQGYASDDTCKDNPIPVPIVINIDNSNFVNEPPTITAPSELAIEGCDENNITDITARYAYSSTESVDIKDSYVNTGYTISNDVISVTYVDIVTPNTSCPLEVTRTYTATNSCGNTADAVQTITVKDTTPATGTTPAGTSGINACASESEIDTIVTIADDITALENAYTDDCGSVKATFVSQSLSGDQCAWSLERNYTISDGCPANDFNVTITHSGSDQTPPSIDNTNLANIELECSQGDTAAKLSDWLDNHAGATASDNCGSVIWTNNYGQDDSVKCDGNAITVTFTATDDCGKSSTTTATYLIKDSEAPSITTEASDKIVECDGNGNTTDLNAWLASHGGAIATDTCSNVTWSDDFSALSDSCGETGSATVTFTATDGCGNKSTTTATFTIQDTTAPSVPTDSGSNVQCLKEATQPTAPIVTDVCGGEIIPVITESSDPICEGYKVYTFKYTDCAGNESVYTYTYTIDLKQFILPTNGSKTVNSLAEAVEPTPPTVTDNCGNILKPSEPVVTETPDCQGTIKYTYTYTDCALNTADWTYTYTIVLAPFTVPENEASSVACITDAVVPTPPTVFDANNKEVIPVMTENADPVCKGDKIYTFTYTDCAGNTADWKYTYTINDDIAPVAPKAPEPMEYQCIDDVPVAGNLTAVDNCAGNITVAGVDSVDNSNPCNITIIRTWTFTDNCNNTSSVAQVITVADKTAPVAPTAPSDMTYQCINDVPVAGNLTAVDNCAGNITVAGVDSVDNSNPCNIIIKRTWTFTDSCNNSSSVSQTITVKDTTAPVLTSDLDTEMDVSCSDIPDKPNLTFEDNCDSNVNVDYSETNTFDETILTDYEIVRTWIVSDACGNKNTYTQTLHVTLDEVVTEITAEDRCYDDGVVNLNDYLQTTNLNGVWEMVEGNTDATLEGSIFNPTTLQLSLDFLPKDGGIDYLFKYTTTDQGCISVTNVAMNINADCKVLPCGSEDVVISKAITPNGDQWNEYFQITGIELCGFEMDVKIFNRWGALVYENSNYQNDWNGKSSSGAIGASGTVPSGTYYYIVILKDSGLNPFTGPVYVGTK